MKIKLIFLIAILIMISGGLAQAFTLPSPIVSADWLAKNKSEVQIVEVATNLDSFMDQPNKNRTSQAEKRIVVDFGGHIEGSVLIDFSTVRVEKSMGGFKVNYLIPSQADFQKIVQATGINNDKPIVLVPFGLNHTDIDQALRILWQFKVYGEDNVSILDGGLTGWLAEGRETSSSNVSKQKGNWAVKGYRSELVATSEDVASASATGKTQLIDARVQSQYSGQTKSEAVRGYGHINPVGHFKLPHLWPVKLPQAGWVNYQSTVPSRARRAVASLSR